MNIKLKNVISQIHGASGIRVIKAILDGERDEEKLLALCDVRIRKHKAEDVKKALRGNYSPQYLMLLKENMRLWDEHQSSIRIIEKEIEQLLDRICADKLHISVDSAPKPARHHNPGIKDLHEKMVRLYGGVNLTAILGINDVTMLRLSGEAGSDMRRFPTVKHFVSRLGLSPKNRQSGKMKKRVKCPSNNAGEIFRQSAQSLLNSKDSATGAFIRRLKGRKGAPIAIKAGARKLAEACYWALTKGLDYVEQGAAKYAKMLKLREVRSLRKLAHKHNCYVIELQMSTKTCH